ncbi:hypothetical protein GWI33_005307 [Rhynchophorus ferrugineus]|uniref:Uncharacterized protein n=1 Tax=Rhynchophorus ferrugineus TaxID=354439 RepID=A0A834IHN9_RHYFE|nr:hypothetical protein GWI33_005307 [Rhynchophorus ferrugineus]
MSTEDCERSGRPKEFVTDENIKITHKMILNYGECASIRTSRNFNYDEDDVPGVVHDTITLEKVPPRN